MTREQNIEVSRANECLKSAREHLDNAMYRLGNIPDDEYEKIRKMYNLICEAQDLY